MAHLYSEFSHFFNGGSFHSYVSHYQRVLGNFNHLQQIDWSFFSNQNGMIHRIGWWENFNRKALYLMVKTMVSCRFSLKPIQWMMTQIVIVSIDFPVFIAVSSRARARLWPWRAPGAGPMTRRLRCSAGYGRNTAYTAKWWENHDDLPWIYHGWPIF